MIGTFSRAYRLFKTTVLKIKIRLMRKRLSIILSLGVLSLLSGCVHLDADSSSSRGESPNSSSSGVASSSSESSSSSSSRSSESLSVSESSSSSSSISNSSSSIDTGAGSYYDAIDWSERGASLKTSLFGVISANCKDIGYDGVKSAYEKTDLDENDKIIDIYTNQHYSYTLSLTASAGAEGAGYNREHIIPQSIFYKKTPMRSDIHHLFPTDTCANARRADYPHGYVSTASFTSSNGMKVGTSDSDKNHGYSGTVCELPDEYKGDVARVYFYMVTRYEDKLSGWKGYGSFSGNSFPSLSGWAIKTYLEWNDFDPVSEKEIKRNNAIYSIQNNRNPFVDHPEAAHYIWDEAS